MNRKKMLVSGALLLTLCISPGFASESTMSLSGDGLDFISSHEEYYSVVTEKNGSYYIGYGTACGKNDYGDGMTKTEALGLLESSLSTNETQVNDFATKYSLSLSQHAFDALVSLTYSVGPSWMNENYRFCSYVIAGLDTVAEGELIDAIATWSHSGGEVVVDYLERRIDEGRMLLYGDYEGESSPTFTYFLLDASEGTVDDRVACYKVGEALGTLPEVTREYYALEGWYKEDGTALKTSDIAGENFSITAKWTATESISFGDVSESDWFFEYVYDLTLSGCINGYSDSVFAPYGTVTWGETLKLLFLSCNYSTQSTGILHWAEPYYQMAVAYKFLENSNIKLDDPITREDLAIVTANIVKVTDSKEESPFADVDRGDITALYELGILTGSEENGEMVFKPDDNLTRAEVSAVIYRVQKKATTQDNTDEADHWDELYFSNKWYKIDTDIPFREYDNTLFYEDEKEYMHYDSDAYNYETGVDVSVYQGTIDWEKVKAAGIDYAIIRVAGRGWGTEGKLYEDTNFRQNIEGALEAGIPVGVYIFSQAVNATEAIEEAAYVLELIDGYDITYPIVFDWEEVSSSSARTKNITTASLVSAAEAFCETIAFAGYEPMVYFNTTCGYGLYDLSELTDYPFWYASYSSIPNFYYNFQMWQYTDSGYVDGIAGKVDMNLYFLPKD